MSRIAFNQDLFSIFLIISDLLIYSLREILKKKVDKITGEVLKLSSITPREEPQNVSRRISQSETDSSEDDGE